MYGMFTYIWLILVVNVGKYIIHGTDGYVKKNPDVRISACSGDASCGFSTFSSLSACALETGNGGEGTICVAMTEPWEPWYIYLHP